MCEAFDDVYIKGDLVVAGTITGLLENDGVMSDNAWVAFVENMYNEEDEDWGLDSHSWIRLSDIESALPFLEKKADERLSLSFTCWVHLCNHKWALPLLEKHVDKLDRFWIILCNHKWALPLLEKRVDKLNQKCWNVLSQQDWALPLLEKSVDKSQ